jgi:predicted ATP-dependent protease
MLRPDVVEAIEAGEFHVFPIKHIDQGIELMTGVEAGEMDEEGNYPEESINERVSRRLQKMAERLAKFGKSEGKDSE